MPCSDNDKLVYNIKELPEAFSIASGDLLVVEDIEGTKTIDFDNIVFGLDNTTFGTTITQNATDIATLSSAVVGNTVGPDAKERNNELYLTPNAVAAGVTQIGSSEHPYDASTPELLRDLQRQYPTDVTWRYLPGVFETFGWKKGTDQQLLNNVSHIGSGIGITTLRLVQASSSGTTTDGCVLGNNLDGLTSNVTVRDITLDGNAVHNPKYTEGNGVISCLQVWGSKITVKNVECIGFGTSDVSECFPMIVGRTRNWNSLEKVGMNTVDSCRFHSPATTLNVGPLTCLLVGQNGDGTGNPLFTAGTDIVTNCQFQGMKAVETGFSVCHGVTAPVVQNCYFEDVDDCVYFEVQSPPSQPVRVDYGRLIVQSNVFKNHRYAIILRQSSPQKALGQLLIQGNNAIQTVPHGDYRGKAFFVLVTRGNAEPAHSIVIRDNNMGFEEGILYPASRDHFMWLVGESGSSTNTQVLDNLVIMNNIVDYRGNSSYTRFINDAFLVLNDHRRNSATPVDPLLDFIGNVTNTGNITTEGFDMTDLLKP